MSNIGQLRKNAVNSFLTSVNYTFDDAIDPDTNFKNKKIQATFSAGVSYYLKFKVKRRTDSSQNFNIELGSSSDTSAKNKEFIKRYIVSSGTSDKEDIFEFIFTPFGDNDELLFLLDRITLDYTIENGRTMDIVIIDLYSINNIIESILTQKKVNGLTDIGLQGNSGQLFMLNGEEIHIGRSGIYELHNKNILIKKLGLVIKDNSDIDFILDYQC